MKHPSVCTVGIAAPTRSPLIAKSVTVGFSGGIDSTVAILLMKERFETVIASTMWLYDGQEASFDQIKAQSDALGVPHRVLDFRKAFQDEVVAEYLRAYEDGLTPNPCIFCNRMIKYGLFLDTVDTDYLALGHYARKLRVEGEWRVFRSHASGKDQSYNLFSLTQDSLERILFPLEEFSSKDEVRLYYLTHFGREIPVQPESMGACFMSGKGHYEFLRSVDARTAQGGYFVDRRGNILGVHEGVSKYTIGQKPRIKKNHPVDGMTSPYKTLGVVCRLDVGRKEVVIGEESDVLANRIYLSDINIISEKRRAQLLKTDIPNDSEPDFAGETRSPGNRNPDVTDGLVPTDVGEEVGMSDGLRKGLRVEVRISQWSEVYTGWCRLESGVRGEIKRNSPGNVSICRGNAANQPCSEESVLIFESDSTKPMRAPVPGQAAVLYIGEELIGGGIIVYSNFPSNKSS